MQQEAQAEAIHGEDSKMAADATSSLEHLQGPVGHLQHVPGHITGTFYGRVP